MRGGKHDTRIEVITDLYEQAVRNVTGSYERWTAFLRSACRNYKCTFDELLLIHEQRPDATAVLTLEDWNNKFGRWVNRGSASIAVFDKAAGNKTTLKHYFDISDTHETNRARRAVPVWDMEERFFEPVIETLENTFGALESKDTLAAALISAAKNAVEDNLPDYLSDLMLCTDGSSLEGLDELNVGHLYGEAVRNSMAYMLLTRCGIDADIYLTVRIFRGYCSLIPVKRSTPSALPQAILPKLPCLKYPLPFLIWYGKKKISAAHLQNKKGIGMMKAKKIYEEV